MQSLASKLAYILYVDPNEQGSIRAKRLVPQGARIAVQNIFELTERPSYVNGTPFLVRLSDDEWFRGSEVLVELQHYWKVLDQYVMLKPAEFPYPVSSVSMPSAIPTIPAVGPVVMPPVGPALGPAVGPSVMVPPTLGLPTPPVTTSLPPSTEDGIYKGGKRKGDNIDQPLPLPPANAILTEIPAAILQAREENKKLEAATKAHAATLAGSATGSLATGSATGTATGTAIGASMGMPNVPPIGSVTGSATTTE